MSVERVQRKSGEVVWRVRWRDHGGSNRSKVLGRKKDAELFEAEVRRRKRTGELAAMDGGRETLDEYVSGVWAKAYAADLRPRTRQNYASSYDRHIGPRLGGMRLQEIDAEVIASFQGDMIQSGAKPHAIRKAMVLLGAILQRAAEGRRIPYNPQRVVRKARLPRSPEVRPLAPATVERLRGALGQRDATIISVLAYAGLRPGEMRVMRWDDIRDEAFMVDAPKTGQRRRVRLLSALMPGRHPPTRSRTVPSSLTRAARNGQPTASRSGGNGFSSRRPCRSAYRRRGPTTSATASLPSYSMRAGA